MPQIAIMPLKQTVRLFTESQIGYPAGGRYRQPYASGARRVAGGICEIAEGHGRSPPRQGICCNISMGNQLRLEWPASLDVSSLLATGWRPLPFREFIVKVHSRCDLSCDYCYMYEMADQSWRSQPRSMSAETAELTARRIGEHAVAHELPGVT